MLTGQPPFGEGDSAQILARILSGTFEADSLPAPLVAWLRRGLDPDPDKRYADATEMLAGWKVCAEALEAGANKRSFWERLIRG